MSERRGIHLVDLAEPRQMLVISEFDVTVTGATIVENGERMVAVEITGPDGRPRCYLFGRQQAVEVGAAIVEAASDDRAPKCAVN